MREAVNDRAILSKSLTKEERGMYFICLLLKADLYTSDALMTCLVLLRYFMYFMALTNHQSVIGQIKSVFVRYEVYVLVFCHMVFWSTVIWMAMAFRWYHRHPEALNFSGDSDKGMVGIMNRVKWIQNGVMQVIFFGTLQWIMVNYTQIWQSVLLAVLLMLEVVLVKMSLYFLTDTIPRDKLFAVMNKGQEILLATINKIILAIGLLSDLNLFSFVRIYLQAALCLTLGALWVFYCLKVKYWSEKANFLVMGLQLFLFVCSLVSFAETIGVHESNALLVASVCYPISLKAGINKIKSLKLSRTFDIKNKTIVNPYASASMDKVLRKADKLGQKNTEYFLYYQGLILEMLKVPKEVCLIKTAEVETVEDLDRVIVQNALKNKLELDSLKLAFFFFLKFPYHNFAFCTIFLGRMKCLMDSRYSDKLQWFYFKLLLESKFEGFYFFKEVDSSKSKDLCGLYRDIAITSNKPPSQEYVNINYPLQCKQVYLVLLEKLKNTTGRLKDQFNYLISCRSISKPVSIHKLYHYNLKLASANAKLKASLSFMREYIPEPPQYYYPALYSYYAGILFDPVKAGEILKLFKSGKETWSLIKSKSKNIRPDSASEDTVVLQMSTAKQNAGEITDATPNAERILKVRPGDKEVIGRNCNELFVDFLQAKHKVFMTGMTAVDKIVNVKGEFFLKLFDKSLNEVDFVIKFAFHIQKYPSMVISLRALNKLHNQFFVITNLTFEIIQAEKGFWRAIGKRKHIDKFNINAICQRINKMGKIVKIVMELDKFKDSKSSSASLSPTFKAMLKNILDSNKNDSLCFIADHGSEMHQKSGISKMIVRFEPGNFGKTFFYKLYITFQGARIAALETVANRSIKNTTFQTFEKSMLDRNNSSEGSFQENEEFYGKYNSKNGETLAFLNTIMADDIIRQLAGILADNNPGSVDLIVGDLKKKLSDLIKEVGLYQKIAAKDLEARTNNLSHLKSASAFPKIVEALEMENNEKSERDDFNNQKELKITNKVKTPQVIKQKLLNQKTTNEHELSASIQKKASTQTNNKLLTTDSIRSDDNRMNLQSLIKSTYGKDNLKDVCRSKSTEKAKLSKPQTILNQAIVENKSYQVCRCLFSTKRS